MDKHFNPLSHSNAKAGPRAPTISPNIDPIEEQASADLRVQATVKQRLLRLLTEAETLSPIQDNPLPTEDQQVATAILPQDFQQSAPQRSNLPAAEAELIAQDILSTLSINGQTELILETAMQSRGKDIAQMPEHPERLEVDSAMRSQTLPTEQPTRTVAEMEQLRMDSVHNTEVQQLKLANKIMGWLLNNIKDPRLQQAIIDAAEDVHTIKDKLDLLLIRLNHEPSSITNLSDKQLWQSYSRISKANRFLDDYLQQRHSALTHYCYKSDVMPRLQSQLAEHLHQRQLNMNLMQEETQLVEGEAARQLIFQVSDQRIPYPYYLAVMLPEWQIDSATINSLLIHLYTAAKLNVPRLFNSKGEELDLYLGFSTDCQEFSNIEDLNLRSICRQDVQSTSEANEISLQDLADYRQYLAILTHESPHQALEMSTMDVAATVAQSNYCLNPVVPITQVASPREP